MKKQDISYKFSIKDREYWQPDPRRVILDMNLEELDLILSHEDFAEGETAEFMELKSAWFSGTLIGLDDEGQ